MFYCSLKLACAAYENIPKSLKVTFHAAVWGFLAISVCGSGRRIWSINFFLFYLFSEKL